MEDLYARRAAVASMLERVLPMALQRRRFSKELEEHRRLLRERAKQEV